MAMARVSRDKHWVFNASEIELSDQVLGRGAFGEVRVAKWRNIHVAAKFLHAEDESEKHNVAEALQQEVEMLSQLRHPNLLLFIGICVDNIKAGNTIILTELMPCSLYDILEGAAGDDSSKVILDLPDITDIALDIGNALNYLHRHSPCIVHRDISAKNILIGANRQAKIADLGQAKIFSLANSERERSRQTTMPGAMAYSAPEVLTGKYTEKIDIFSFGVLLTQMCCGEYPRIDRREEQIAKAHGKYPMLKHLIVSSTNFQPSDRSTAFFLCESLELIKSNDRYYPSSRKTVAEKDIGILTRRWMRLQIDQQTRDTRIALEQTTRRLIAEESRWRSEAERVDSLQAELKAREDDDNERKEKLFQAQAKLSAAELKAAQLGRANDNLNRMLSAATQDKKDLSDQVQARVNEMVKTAATLDDTKSLANQYQDQAEINELLLAGSREQEEEARQRINSLKAQLEMQLTQSRDLESRLEQALSRWKHDKEFAGKETARCTKLSATCSGLIEKNEKFEAEIRRYDARLKQYDELPLPAEIKARMADLGSDVSIMSLEVKNLTTSRNDLIQDKLQLEDVINDQRQVIERSTQTRTQHEETLQQQQAQIEEMTDKVSFLEQNAEAKEAEAVTLQLERNHAREAGRIVGEQAKQLKADLIRETKVVAHLRRMHNIGGVGNEEKGGDKMYSLDGQDKDTGGNWNDVSEDLLGEGHGANEGGGQVGMAMTADSKDGSAIGAHSEDREKGEGEGSKEVGSTYKKYMVPDPSSEGERLSELSVKTLIEHTVENNQGASGILQLMMELKQDERVAWRACRALREIILKSDGERALCYSSKIEELLLFYLINYAHMGVVQANCIRLVGALSFGNDLFRRKVGEKGIMQCILNAMNLHGDDHTVQLHICTTITNLSHNSLENRSRFFEQGGVEALIGLMERHLESAKYQRQACWAILTLSGSDELARKIALDGGDSAIIKSMLHHSADAGVQQFGCWALSNMALSSAEIARKLKKKGVVEVCRIALETHAADGEVVRQAKHALGVFGPAVDSGLKGISSGKHPVKQSPYSSRK